MRHGDFGNMNRQGGKGNALISDVATYYFYGTSSGKNSTVICGDGHACYIECYNNA